MISFLAVSINLFLVGASLVFGQAISLETEEGSAYPNTGPTLIAHWPMLSDADNRTELKLASKAKGVTFESVTSNGITRRAARFDGRDSVIEVASEGTASLEALQLGGDPFSIAMWLNAPEASGDSVGDLISQFDYGSRTGFHLGVYSHGGVTNSQPNARQVHFGIDSGKIDPAFKDHGRLGDGVFVFSMCVHRGRLYASTSSAGKDQAGHVYRFEGEDQWTDLGSPDEANSISAMATFDGNLYVASSKYRLGWVIVIRVRESELWWFDFPVDR